MLGDEAEDGRGVPIVFGNVHHVPGQVAEGRARVRNRTTGFLHRMIDLLRENVTPYLATTMDKLLRDADMVELKDTLSLFNQLGAPHKVTLAPSSSSRCCLVSALKCSPRWRTRIRKRPCSLPAVILPKTRR